MKKLMLCLLVFFTLSCHKQPDKVTTPIDTCPGHFVGMGSFGSKSQALAGFEIDSIRSGPTGYYFEISGYLPGYSAYDNMQKQFYVFSGNGDSLYLNQYSFEKKTMVHYRYQGSVSPSPNTANGRLLCSGITNKLYCIYNPYDTDSAEQICELTATGDICTQRTIYNSVDPEVHITWPVLDEHNGNIYFISGSRFFKVDPSNNTIGIIATFNGVQPTALVFAETDGMFYGIDIATSPNNFIRIDPANGFVTKLGLMPYSDTTTNSSVGMYDHCRNCYIAMHYSTSYAPTIDNGIDLFYIDIKTGVKIKEYHKQAFWASACINN